MTTQLLGSFGTLDVFLLGLVLFAAEVESFVFNNRAADDCGGASACVKLVSSNDKTEVVLPLQLADERSDVDELYWTFKVAWRQTQTLKDVFIDRMKCR